MWNRNRKPYRWLKGGKWAFMEGRWYHAHHNVYTGRNDHIYEFGQSFHFGFGGITKREVYPARFETYALSESGRMHSLGDYRWRWLAKVACFLYSASRSGVVEARIK